MSIESVYAVGIGYGYTPSGPIDFQPEMEKTLSYFVISNAGRVMDHEITVEGALKQYVTLSSTLIEDVPSGAFVPFSATVKLPAKMPAGLHEATICVAETETRGGGMIGAKTRACGGFIIRVLSGEKYLKISRFDVPNVDIGEKLKIELAVKSWSEVDINSIKVLIDISKPTIEKEKMEKIATVSTEEKQLKSNAEEILTAYFDTAGMEAGEYVAFATLYYDGEHLNDSRGFRLGTLTIKILNYTKEFEQGKVNRLGVQVLSQWNRRIDGIYSTVDIEDERLITPLTSLEPWQNITLVTYWDTTNKKIGNYKGKIIIYYSNKTTEEDAEFRIVVGREKMRTLIMNIIITFVIVILIISLVIMFLKTRKASREEGIKAKAKRSKHKKKGE